MTKQSIYLPIEISDLAEGSPKISEPESPLKTTSLPVIDSETETHAPVGETGILSAVHLKAEGKDKDDAQDASLSIDETRTAPVTQAAPEKKHNGTPNVLIIEDATELAEIIQATLERMNIVTAHETHGLKAIAKFNEMQPDVVLLDISLPDMTGWKILDTLKERQEQGVPHKMPAIIVITAYGDPANRLVAKLQGVHSYLIKPFTTDEVEKVVMSALGSAAQ